MESEKTVKAEETPKKNKSTVNSVILVQTAVCAIIIFFIVAVGKISPPTFEFLKNEYNQIMSVDMSTKELAECIVSAAQKATSIQASAAEPIEEETEKEEKKAVAVMATLGSTDKITVPVHGRITSKYGYRTNPISGVYGLHTGVDIANKEGTPIVAAYDGVIKDIGTGTKRGKYVLMRHSDGSETLYCHCSKITVDEDSVIKAGEVIGLIGSTGWSTGPHLHFEIHRNGNAIDPLKVLDEDDI